MSMMHKYSLSTQAGLAANTALENVWNLKYTRAMVRAALAGKLNDVETETNGVFGLANAKSN